MTSVLRRYILTAAAVLACAPVRADPLAPQQPTHCRLGEPPAQPRDTVTIGLRALPPLDALARPEAQDPLLAATLFRGLVSRDCAGRLQPDLATEWTRSTDGRQWTVTLRRDLLLADGAPLTAPRVLEAWRRHASGRLLVPWAGLERADLLDEHRLVLVFAESSAGLPTALAHPGLALETQRVEPTATGWLVRWGERIVRFVASPTDQRDLLDRGVDLLVTGEPRVLRYGGAHAEYLVRPLAAAETYVLLLPTGGAADPDRLADLRLQLARDLADGATTPAGELTWWSAAPAGCLVADAPLPVALAPSPTRTLVYPVGDDAARGLAERLAALAATEPLPWWETTGRGFARGLEPHRFAQALHDGTAAGFILPLPAESDAPCFQRGRLLQDAPWLALAGAAAVPLVARPLSAVVRRGTADWVEQAGGTVRLAGPR